MDATDNKKRILMGNEAIGLGIVDNGCTVVSSYPGTPASEILASVARYKIKNNLKVHVEWSVNEKCAFEVALANSYMGCRSAAAMKQVGLNVALDPLMSAAYTGIVGGFLIISADDPGPHSSQTEQDSRLIALFAKIPVLDPSSPHEAYQMIQTGLELSEKYSVPVMLRPTTRVCHARQNITTANPVTLKRKSIFIKDPARWAATPKYRLKLHKDLNKKLHAISLEKQYNPFYYKKKKTTQKYCIISSGVAYAYVLDLLNDLNLHDRVALCKVSMPYPLNLKFILSILTSFEKILIIEETYPVIELQIPQRTNVFGKLNGYVPQEGEITPDIVWDLLAKFLDLPIKPAKKVKHGGQRPSLCAGCPHRASFFAIKKALPKALYPGDIGCYTLGINFGAVDTCLCMGASINQAAGFYHSYKITGSEAKPIVATIGDSTFIHSGITALVNSVYNDARFILVILDNSTTAMTGNQPTAATGTLPDGLSGNSIPLEQLVEGCGIKFIRVVDPYNIQQFTSVIKNADVFTRSNDGGIAVIIARRPCLMNTKNEKTYSVSVSQDCTGCQYCVLNFECPAFVFENDKCTIDKTLCSGCGVCVHVCPVKAIKIEN